MFPISEKRNDKMVALTADSPTSIAVTLYLLCFQLLLTTTAVSSLSSVNNNNRAWVIPKGVSFGALDRMKLQNIGGSTTTTVKDDDDNKSMIQIATRAIGLNFADIFTICGYYKAANEARRNNNNDDGYFCPGLEFSGVVLHDHYDDDDDSEVNKLLFSKGDRVFGFTRFGAYQDVVTTSKHYIRKLPNNWSFEEGASFLVNALTAWHGLVTVAGMPNVSDDNATKEKKELLHQKKTIVLVHSAAGGVGLWASELAARRGGVVVGIVGQEDKKKVFNNRILPICPHAQCVVRSSSASQFERELRQAVVQARHAASAASSDSCSSSTSVLVPQLFQSSEECVNAGWGIDHIMECYGGKYFTPSLNLLNAGGSLATYGSTTYNGNDNNGSGTSIPLGQLVWKYLTRPRIDPGMLTTRNIRVGGFNLIFLTERIEELNAALNGCIACLGSSSGGENNEDIITPAVVGNVFEYDTGAVQALQLLRSGKTVGKVVLSNSNNPNLL